MRRASQCCPLLGFSVLESGGFQVQRSRFLSDSSISRPNAIKPKKLHGEDSKPYWACSKPKPKKPRLNPIQRIVRSDLWQQKVRPILEYPAVPFLIVMVFMAGFFSFVGGLAERCVVKAARSLQQY